MGERNCEKHTLPRSFTPCLLTPCRHRERFNSFIVIGCEGFSRPWSIQDCMRSRLTGDISTLNLEERSVVGLYNPTPPAAPIPS